MDTIQKTLGMLAVGILIGHFALPKEKDIQIKEVIKYERNTQENKDQKKDKNVTIIETTSPDGTKKKETKIGETTTTTTETSTTTKVTDDKSTSIKGSKTSIGLIAISELNKNILTKSPEYGITISRSLIGSISLNGLLTTDKRIGIGVSLGF
jgi:cytoskeletal protein RodZ